MRSGNLRTRKKKLDLVRSVVGEITDEKYYWFVGKDIKIDKFYMGTIPPLAVSRVQIFYTKKGTLKGSFFSSERGIWTLDTAGMNRVL